MSVFSSSRVVVFFMVVELNIAERLRVDVGENGVLGWVKHKDLGNHHMSVIKRPPHLLERHLLLAGLRAAAESVQLAVEDAKNSLSLVMLTMRVLRIIFNFTP